MIYLATYGFIFGGMVLTAVALTMPLSSWRMGTHAAAVVAALIGLGLAIVNLIGVVGNG